MEFKFIFLKYQTWVLLLFSNNQSSLFLAAIIRKNDYFCGKKYHARYVPLWKPAGFSILQCSALIKRTLLSFAKVVFFFLIAKAIPLKNRENQTSYHYCTFVAHLGDENR